MDDVQREPMRPRRGRRYRKVTRYVHQRSEGLTRRKNDATPYLKEKTVEFRLGQRVNVDEYGDGRVCRIDKFYAIVAIEFDKPYGEHNLRKRAFAEEWLVDRCRILDGRAEAL